MESQSRKRPALQSLPYSDRQMIVVSDDEVVEALHEAELEASSETEVEHGSSEVVLRISEIAIRMLFGGPSTALVEIAEEGIKAWRRAREQGIPIRQVGKSEANDLDFPPGHPRDTVVYVGHPAMHTVYYPIADFHRVTFEHKFSEAISLLMHLGANKIRVEHVRGWSREFSNRLSVPLTAIDENITVETGFENRSQVQLLFEAELAGVREPTIPDSLVWYQHEPTWRSIAEGRMKFGLKQFSLVVAYEDDYGVNAGLKASAIKAGFDIAGKFEDHEATMWKITGCFRTPE